MSCVTTSVLREHQTNKNDNWSLWDSVWYSFVPVHARHQVQSSTTTNAATFLPLTTFQYALRKIFNVFPISFCKKIFTTFMQKLSGCCLMPKFIITPIVDKLQSHDHDVNRSQNDHLTVNLSSSSLPLFCPSILFLLYNTTNSIRQRNLNRRSTMEKQTNNTITTNQSKNKCDCDLSNNVVVHHCATTTTTTTYTKHCSFVHTSSSLSLSFSTIYLSSRIDRNLLPKIFIHKRKRLIGPPPPPHRTAASHCSSCVQQFTVRFLFHQLIVWLLLLSLCLSATGINVATTYYHRSSRHLLSSSPSMASLLAQKSTSSTEPYMKPSQFFNRYFSCRYELKSDDTEMDNFDDETLSKTQTMDKSQKSQWDNELRLSSSSNETFVSSSSSSSSVSSSSIVSTPLVRHSRQQTLHLPLDFSQQQKKSLQKKQRLSCTIDCDGITKWPETMAASVRHISCLDVLRDVQQKPSTVVNDYIVEETKTNANIVDGSSTVSSINSEIVNLIGLDSTEHVSIENYMHNEKKLASANATRRCTVDGIWEPQADYSKCGLDSHRLFVLTPQQLDKIYDIREKMIQSKYTQLIQSEKEFYHCVDNVLSQPPSRLPEPYCERTFDGWTCFNDTKANEVIYFQCPDFIYGFNPQNQAHKTCTKQGTWKVHSQTLVPWTNYTSCVDIPDYHFRNMIIRLHIIGYSGSLFALLISVIIFFSFKTLSSQTRIRIHKNFFVSFIINNFMWIIWYFAITDQNILFENGWYCQLLHVLLHYFLVCNYFWMFCEGLYLHTILVVAFVSEEKILKWFYLIGWGIPVIFATTYATFRASSPADAQNCWIDESKYTWILNVPVLLSFVLNIFFLFNIVRVLVTKLQAVNTVDQHQTRKAVRATLILIPLLGLHFILTPFRPESNSSAAQAYEVFSAMVSSLQGLCVAMLFCFFNGEVQVHVKKRWENFLLVHGYRSNRRMSYGNTTISIRLSNCNLNNSPEPPVVNTVITSNNTTVGPLTDTNEQPNATLPVVNNNARTNYDVNDNNDCGNNNDVEAVSHNNNIDNGEHNSYQSYSEPHANEEAVTENASNIIMMAEAKAKIENNHQHSKYQYGKVGSDSNSVPSVMGTNGQLHYEHLTDVNANATTSS